MVTHYEVVFDISQKGFNWWFPSVGLFFLIAGVVLAWTGRRQKWARWKITGYGIIGFSSFWTVIVLTTTLREYFVLHQEYRNGHCFVVESEVENFRAMPYDGHQEECFSVKHTTFCYSDLSRP